MLLYRKIQSSNLCTGGKKGCQNHLNEKFKLNEFKMVTCHLQVILKQWNIK